MERYLKIVSVGKFTEREVVRFNLGSRIEQMTAGQCIELKKTFDRLFDDVGPNRFHLFYAVSTQ